MSHEIYDITIIGAGPVGLFTAFYAGLRNCKVKIIDSLEQFGGQPRYLYPEKNIFDIPAYPQINGYQLAQKLHQQLERFPITYALGQEIQSLHYDQVHQAYQLHAPQQTHLSKTVIIAAGNGAFSPKKLTLENIDHLEGKHLHYYVENLSNFRDKTVLVCGGGDSALDWALMLNGIAKKVYLIHRRDKFRALEHTVTELQNSSVEVLTPCVPISIQSKSTGEITTVSIQKVKNDAVIHLEVDDILVNYGFSSSMTTIRQWGLEMERSGIKVTSQLETSLPGVFAVGDIASYPGKLKLIATGFGEAPLAVQQALNFMNPDQPFIPIHSSDLLS